MDDAVQLDHFLDFPADRLRAILDAAKAALAPAEPSYLYNIACAYAMKKNTKLSVKWLKKAIDKHPEYKKEAQEDPNFGPIKNTSEFKKAIK